MRKIIRKTLLYKSGVEYADYCINHVEGCSHGCKYPCYAMMMKKRCGIIKNYNDWIKPKIVIPAHSDKAVIDAFIRLAEEIGYKEGTTALPLLNSQRVKV